MKKLFIVFLMCLFAGSVFAETNEIAPTDWEQRDYSAVVATGVIASADSTSRYMVPLSRIFALIESGDIQTAVQTIVDAYGSGIKTAYEGEADTNALTNDLLSKLNAIEANATGDMTPTEIIAAIDSVLGTDWKTSGGDSLPACVDGEVPYKDAGAWTCADPNTIVDTTDTLENLNCTASQVAAWDGFVWACADMTGSGAVDSVNGQTGVVVLDADDLAETATRVFPTPTQEVNWDTAFSWGDHAGFYSLLSHNHDSTYAALTGATFTGAVSAPSFESSASDGEHYANFYNSIAPTFTPSAGDVYLDSSFVFQIYNGSSWAPLSAGTDDQNAGEVPFTTYLTITSANVQAAIEELKDEVDAVSVGSGYVTAPTYSDDTCTTGQRSFDTSYIYLCESTDSWDRYPVTFADWSNPTPTPPTLTSATIPTTGATISLLASEAITIGTGGNGGWNLDCTTAGTDITMTYSSGDTTDTLVYTLGSTVNSGDTCDVDYTQPGDGWEDSAGDDLASITSGSVTNNSTQSGSVTLAYESYAANATSSGVESITVTKPTGTTEGDLLFAYLVSDASGAWDTFDGYTEITSGGIANGSSNMTTAYKIATGSEPTDYTFGQTGGTYLNAVVARYSKTSGSWSISGYNSNTATGTVSTGSVTTSSADIFIGLFGSDDGGISLSDYDGLTQISYDSSGSSSLGAYYQTGLSGSISKTFTSASGGNVAIGVAIHAE